MPITYTGAHAIGASSDANTCATGASSFDGSTTPANLIVLAGQQYSSPTGVFYSTTNNSVPTSANHDGNTWTALTAHINTTLPGRSQLAYCLNPTVSTTMRFAFNGTTIYPSVAAQGFAGVDSYDNIENGASANATTVSTGTVTANQSGDLYVTSAGCNSGAYSSINGGFTTTDSNTNAGLNEAMAMAYLVGGASANPQFTWNSSQNLSASIAGFKATASGIQFDAASNSGDKLASSSYTFNRTVTGANTFLAVDVAVLSVGGSVTSITDDSAGGAVPLVFIGKKATVTALGTIESWGLAGAVTGTKSISVVLSGSMESVSVAASYTGVHQTSPTEAYNSAQATNAGSATDASVVITTVADNDWVHAALITDDLSVTAGNTSRNNVAGTLGTGANEDNNAAKTPAGTVTMSYTGEGITATWAIGGYGIRPVGAGGTVWQDSAILAGVGTLTTSATLTMAARSTMAGVGTLSASASMINIAVATLAGVGTLTVGATLTLNARSVLTGIGTLTAVGNLVESASATLGGVGTLFADAGANTSSALLSGTGTLSVRATLRLNAASTLPGVGTLGATAGAANVPASATLFGIGTLFASATVRGPLWTIVNDSQTPNWALIPDNQTSNWTIISTD